MPPINDAADAIARFREIRKRIGFGSAPGERLTASRGQKRHMLAIIKESFMPREYEMCIRAGKYSELDSAGECWIVSVDLGGMLGGQVACFDTDGRLLCAWYVPEG